MKEDVTNSKKNKWVNVSSLTLFFFFSPLSGKNFQDALCYIDKIKLAYLPTKPYVYHSFLEIMLLFRNGWYVRPFSPPLPLAYHYLLRDLTYLINWYNSTTTKDVMEMAVALFGTDGVKGRECLLGLSAFCPQGCEIRQGNGEGEWVLLMP